MARRRSSPTSAGREPKHRRRRDGRASSRDTAASRRIFGSVKAWIVGVGAIAGAVGAVLGIVLTFVPGLKPCFGDTTAIFSDVSVTKVGPLEVQVSYTIQTHGY